MRAAPILVAVAVAACSPPRGAADVRASSSRARTAARTSGARNPGCVTPDARDRAIAFGGEPLVPVCRGVYTEGSTTAEERDALARAYAESVSRVAAVFGRASQDPPAAVACKTDACAAHFAGPTRRSRATLEPSPMVVVVGFGPRLHGTMLHEMVHVEIARRMGGARGALPTWFDEGVATYLGDNALCPEGTKRAIDDLRRLDTAEAWTGFTNMTGRTAPAYCQARAEIAAWVAVRGRAAIVGVIDAVASGRAFDDAYGPLLTAVPEEAHARSLDGRFPLDENVGTDAADASGRSHIATLMEGAIWTTGRRGAGVKVLGGAHVRADGFAELGVPDAPFSLSLWVKPLASAGVLVHTAANASGGDGWCVPLLGHDANGHLVAQVPHGNDPRSILTATGPVLPPRGWSHVVATWRAAEGVRLYVNGALAASAPPRSRAERHRLAPASPLYLFFGSDHGARCWPGAIEPGDWNGALDEVRVYDHALTAEEVARETREM